jgi:HSP20 family molecular chaperone IbpA
MYDNFTELMGSGCGSQSARVIESSMLGDIFPKVNIVVESNLYKIIAELPGIDHKDISVSLRRTFRICLDDIWVFFIAVFLCVVAGDRD